MTSSPESLDAERADFSSPPPDDFSGLPPEGEGAGGTLPEAGKLTAGIINDFGKWSLWHDIQENELKRWRGVWYIHPERRYPVHLSNKRGFPLADVEVQLMDGERVVWTARTDNTGRAELWPNLYDTLRATSYGIRLRKGGQDYRLEKSAQAFENGGTTHIADWDCDLPQNVDIAFVVDATGSMSDEINYLKTELLDVIGRSKKALGDSELRLGSVFYRDLGDAYVCRKSHFSTDLEKTNAFIKEQEAGGGGDYPEAIEEALDEALDGLVWSERAAARLLFLLMDAPPHQDEATKERLRLQIERAAEMGIRIIPVACSGTDRSTEYLMRSIALATNGSYIHLTDDSGIGGSHLDPITDKTEVERLNDLLVKTITDFSTLPECEQPPLAQIAKTSEDTSQVARDSINPLFIAPAWKYYPNPCAGKLFVEMEESWDCLYLYNSAGKLLRRLKITGPRSSFDLRQYPAGTYYIRPFTNGEYKAVGTLVLMRPG